MSKQDVAELLDQAIQQGIASGVDVDELEAMIDEKKARLEAVRAFQDGEEVTA